MNKKIVLGFSGGLDTTFCVIWLRENAFEPVCVCLDIGQSKDLEEVRHSAKLLGIKELKIIDGKNSFADLFLAPALKANGLYQGVYPLATAVSRPFIGKILVDVAREEGTHYVAHGCAGKGNDPTNNDKRPNLLLESSLSTPFRFAG